MSNTASVEQIVSNYLNKVKKSNDTEELLYADNLPNTESVAQLLQRVAKTPQILHSLITTSLPYLLITPQKIKKKKLMRANNKIKENAPQKVKTRLNKKTKSVGGILLPSVSETQLMSQSMTAATSKLQLSNKFEIIKKKPTKKRKVLNKALKSSSNLLRDASITKASLTSITKKKGNLIQKEHILSELLKKSLLDDSINSQKKISNALKHSSLFSITEKSYLGLNNYAPVEVDTLLLQKLIALDKKVAKNVITGVLNNEGDILAPDSSEKSSTTDDEKDKVKKKKKKSTLKRELVKELRNILLVRLKTDKERPAEILYNVVLKLCKKNKIANGLQFRKVQHSRKQTEPALPRSHNRLTSKKLKQGSQKLKTLINKHQQLLEKLHS